MSDRVEAEDRCSMCDRIDCAWNLGDHSELDERSKDCRAHAVDWRARCLAAEALLRDLVRDAQSMTPYDLEIDRELFDRIAAHLKERA